MNTLMHKQARLAIRIHKRLDVHKTAVLHAMRADLRGKTPPSAELFERGTTLLERTMKDGEDLEALAAEITTWENEMMASADWLLALPVLRAE